MAVPLLPHARRVSVRSASSASIRASRSRVNGLAAPPVNGSCFTPALPAPAGGPSASHRKHQPREDGFDELVFPQFKQVKRWPPAGGRRLVRYDADPYDSDATPLAALVPHLAPR